MDFLAAKQIASAEKTPYIRALSETDPAIALPEPHIRSVVDRDEVWRYKARKLARSECRCGHNQKPRKFHFPILGTARANTCGAGPQDGSSKGTFGEDFYPALRATLSDLDSNLAVGPGLTPEFPASK